jgi:hypothetical protein
VIRFSVYAQALAGCTVVATPLLIADLKALEARSVYIAKGFWVSC